MVKQKGSIVPKCLDINRLGISYLKLLGAKYNIEKLIAIARKVKTILPIVHPLRKDFLFFDSQIIGHNTPVTPRRLKEE